MEHSDELLVYDLQNNEYLHIDKIAVNDKDKAFLQCLYEAEDFLTTMEIGEITGIDRNLIHYRYDKFGRKRYTEILDINNVNPDELPQKLEKMKEVRLTDRGQKLIESGLINLNEDHLSEDIILSRDEFEGYVRRIHNLEQTVGDQNERIQKLEDEIISIQQKRSDTDDLK